MKLAKRLVSVALALLMAFSCFSLLASADTSDIIAISVQYYREVTTTTVGDDGTETTVTEWIPTTKVARGDKIKARVFMDTNFAAGVTDLFWMYPEDFMSYSVEGLSTETDGVYIINGNTNAEGPMELNLWKWRSTFGAEGDEGVAWNLTDDGSTYGDSYEPYIPMSDFTGYDWVNTYTTSGSTATVLSSGTEGTDKYGDKYWLYELDFVVNENAESKGYLKMHPDSIVDPDTELGVTMVNKQPTGEGGDFCGGLVDILAEYFTWDFSQLNDEANWLSLDQTVTFDAGDNGTISGTSEYTGYIGEALSAIDTFAVPTVTANAGYKQTGWEIGTVSVDADGQETVTYSGDVITDPAAYIVDYDKTVLKAVYETTEASTSNYTVNVYEMDVDGKYPETPTSAKADNVGEVGAEVTYTFDAAANIGFSVDKDKSTADLKTTVTEDDTDVINVYLKRDTYTVKYVDENGDAIASLPDQTLYYGKTYNVAAEVAKTGYTFTGWKSGDATVAAGSEATVGTADVVYQATYTADANKVIINAVYDDVATGGEATKPFEISAATGYEVKSGYTVKIVDELPAAGTEEANVTYVLKSALAVDHYTLVDGQTLEVAVADDGNAVLNLNYIVNQYTVKFLDEDGASVVESYTENYLTEIEAPEGVDKSATGKTFEKWVGSDGTELLEYDLINVEKDVTYTASYTKDEFTISYIVDGETPDGFTEPEGGTYNYGDTFKLEDVAPVTGWTFSGWTVTGHASYDDTTKTYTVGTENIEVTGEWTHDWYTVTFYLDEGMTQKLATKRYHYGETIVGDPIAQDKILGYQFDGWVYEDVDGSVITTATMPAMNVNATPILTAYTVTFYDVYESSVDSITDIPQLTADMLPDMTENEAENNYTFVNWKVGSFDGEDAIYPMNVTGNIELYAYGTVDVIFYTDRDESGEPINEHKKYTFAFGYEITEDDIADLTEPTKLGYKFNGWDNVVLGPAESHNIAVAQWKIQSYTATFNAVNGDLEGAFADDEVTKTVENVEFNSDIVFADEPVLAGYTFTGWSEDGLTKVDALKMDAEGKTYTALYTKNGEISYTVEIYLMNTDGSYPAAASKSDATKSGTIGTDVSAAHADYIATLDSFYAADDTAANVTEATLTADGATLKLYYARSKYAVTVDGAAEGEVYHGATFTAPAAPEAEEGKEFAGWSDGATVYAAGDEITVEGALALTSTWNDLKYTVTFNSAEGNEISKVENVLYGTVLSAEQISAAEAALPSLEGKGLKYTGWDKDTAAAIKADTVITATTANETYVIKFVTGIDGLTVNDLTVTYGEDITDKVAPLTAEGLTFNSWVADLETLGAVSYEIGDLGDEGASETWYAYWTADITFVDGDASATETLAKDAEILANAPAFAGKGADYEAGVWYTEPDGKGDALTADAVVTANATYYAYYAPKTNISYKVEIYEEKLDSDEYALADTIVISNATAGAPAAYSEARTGFTFEKNEPADAVVASDLVLKAYYTRDTVTITVDGQEAVYEVGATLDPAAPAVTDGQVFDKWVDADGAEFSVPATVTVDMDGLELKSTYRYVITFIGNDGATLKADAQPEGELIVAPNASDVADYTFQGWYTAANGQGTKLDTAADKVTGVATYYAYYTADTNISYTVEIYEEKLGSDEYALVDTITINNATAGASVAYSEARTGFTFEKNEPADAVAATGLVLKAYYTRNLVNVTVNGEAKQVEYGSDINEPTPVAPAGQEFDKWIDETGAVITAWPVIAVEGKVVEAVYKNSEIMITFMDGDKVVSSGNQTFGETLALYDYAPEGYTFDGWYTEAEFINKVAEGAPVPATATTYYAKTTVKTFSLSFVIDDVTVAGYPKTVDYNSDIVAPAHTDKTAEGYIFAGWFDADGNKLVENMPAKDLVYTARYTLDTEPVEYTIEIYHMATDGKTYELSGSTVAYATIGTEQSVTPGNVKGFTVDAALSNTKDTVTADGKMTLTIYYARNLYTVSFDGAESQVLYGAALPEVEAPAAAEGKTFAGWVEATSGKKNTEYGSMPDSDLVFESTWTDAVYTITYVVDGEVKKPIEYVYGAAVETPETPTAIGMKFVEWTPEVPKTMPAENLIIVAKFEPNVYTATFTVDGKPVDTKVIEYGDEIVLPAVEPTKANYEFTGWAGYTDGMTMPAEDLTFEATFDRVKVMLVPKNDTCSTVIDRAGGTVDDYVDGESVWYVYGLKEKLKESVLRSDYIDVQGDGRIEIEYRQKDDGSTYAPYTGTGTVIKVYDNVTGELVESFYIVIFGDVNGDSFIQSADAAVVNDEALMAGGIDALWSVEGLAGYKPYMLKAANLDGDQIVTSTDTALIKNTALGISTIDQTAAAVTDL